MRVVVTRPREQAAQLVARLEALGHEVVVCPLIGIEPVGPDEIDVSGYDWVVVTSANGARELFRRQRGRLPRLAVIGPGTADAVRAHGVEPDLVAGESTQEGLVAEFPRPPGRVLFAGAEAARPHLVDALGADFVPLYRTLELELREPPRGDLVVLASPSAARVYGRLGVRLPTVSIGPETTRAARETGVEVVREAEPHTLDGLVAAVAAVRLPQCSSRS